MKVIKTYWIIFLQELYNKGSQCGDSTKEYVDRFQYHQRGTGYTEQPREWVHQWNHRPTEIQVLIC